MLTTVLLLLNSLVPSAQADSWEDMHGCYTPVEVNGRNVRPKDWMFSTILIQSQWSWGQLPDGTRPKALEFILYHHSENGNAFNEGAAILEGQGTTQTSPDGLTTTWSLKGPVIYEFPDGRKDLVELESVITVSSAGDFRWYKVRSYRAINGAWDADDVYLLERRACGVFP